MESIFPLLWISFIFSWIGLISKRCIWVYVCVYVNVSMFVCVCVCAYLCMTVHVYMFVSMCLCVRVCLCLCVCVYECVHVRDGQEWLSGTWSLKLKIPWGFYCVLRLHVECGRLHEETGQTISMRISTTPPTSQMSIGQGSPEIPLSLTTLQTGFFLTWGPWSLFSYFTLENLH